MKDRKRKIIVIGVDCATFSLIKPWAEKGKLPTFRKLMSEGVHAGLESTIPPMTPPAWTSIVTGVNPGKHGIYNAYEGIDHSFKFVNSTCRKSAAIWNLLSEKNYRSIVINVPVTYPPEKIEGIMVSGMYTPSIKSNFTYPRRIKEDLLTRGYEIWAPAQGNKDQLKNSIQKRAEATVWLMEEFSWDFLMVVFMAIDKAQHLYWGNWGTLLEIYRKIDDAAGMLINEVPSDAIVIVLSDHGYGSYNKAFYINNWLRRSGFLKSKKQYSLLKPLGFARYLPISGIRKIVDILPEKLLKSAFHKAERIFSTPSQDIDFKQTKAYNYPDSDSITIIKESSAEYEKLRNNLNERLLDVVDPSDGSRVIKKVLRREEVYWGPYVGKAPDLVIELPSGYLVSPDFDPLGRIVSSTLRRSSFHRRRGIFVMAGTDIRKHASLKGKVATWDVVPTILHMLKLPIPSYLDGIVLKECFVPGSEMAKRDLEKEVKTIKIEKEEWKYKDWEAEKIKERLKALGYLG